MEQRTQAIIEACAREKETNPLAIFRHVAGQDFVRIHGPEHHVLDGACLLTALHHAGMEFDLPEQLNRLRQEGLQMPGAICGHWGVCGAVASVGAALALLEGTGPLTTDSSWGSHMTYTARALANLAAIGGPRCCKRDAFTALKTAIPYVKERFGIDLPEERTVCGFYLRNQQCLGKRCPYNPEHQAVAAR
ncbi:DUF5714 domain-containing protein [Acidaminococcus timonensis]